MRRTALACLLLASCAGGAAAQREARLERQLEELRRRTDADRRAAHELENRIFILEDKLDTAQVAQGREMARGEAPPKLPVITKGPEVSPPPPRDEEPASTGADDGGPPVVIRMDGRTRAPPRSARLDTRDLDAIDEKLPVAPLPRTPRAGAGGAAMDEYQRAYQALGRREHAAAIAGFRAFVAAHPQHEYADNAQYWLGEAYYDQADFATALAEFRAVLKRYPGGNKAPDALLKVGFCLTKLGDAGAASDVLGQVVEIYPKTDAARLAMKRLDEIRRAR
jgi:tol-pal system protein YbgF